MGMAYIHFIESGRLRTISMSPYYLLMLLIIMNNLSFVKLNAKAIAVHNMTCVNIPLASLSSRGDDRLVQLKLFAAPQFISNYSASCGKFDMYVVFNFAFLTFFVQKRFELVFNSIDDLPTPYMLNQLIY